MVLVRRMALVALVIGTALSVAATERIDLPLVASTSLGWSFVPVLQLLTGFVLVWGAQGGAHRALTVYFGTHWPWSLWILSVSAILALIPGARELSRFVLISAILPLTGTVILLLRLCREEFGMSRTQARRRVAWHQGLTVLLALAYFSLAVALWPRIVGDLS